MTRRTIVFASVAAVAVLLAGTAVALVSSPPDAPTNSASVEPSPSAPVASLPEPGGDTPASLRYLIEEEKLAHDVYVTLAELWGGNVFANISASETTHQELLLPLLEVRDLADPRSPEVGVFLDAELQALYDALIERGSVSRAEAIQVGVAIEQRDISDLAVAIAAEDDADVISVYERLLGGSENHLAAFERQI